MPWPVRPWAVPSGRVDTDIFVSVKLCRLIAAFTTDTQQPQHQNSAADRPGHECLCAFIQVLVPGHFACPFYLRFCVGGLKAAFLFFSSGITHFITYILAACACITSDSALQNSCQLRPDRTHRFRAPRLLISAQPGVIHVFRFEDVLKQD